MTSEIDGEDHLVFHYSNLDDLQSDFRNYNLFNLVTGLVKGRSVVDIGCGAAFLLNLLKKQGKKVMGIEPTPGLRALASKINPEVPILAGVAEDVDTLISEPVDTVLMIDVLEHIKEDSEQVKKVRSALKSDGEFIIVVPNHSYLYGQRDKAMGHYRRYSKAGLRDILIRNGFRIQYMRRWNALGFLPYLISEKVFRRPLNTKLRQKIKKGTGLNWMQKALNFWFSCIENTFDFGFGLSLIVVAKKT